MTQVAKPRLYGTLEQAVLVIAEWRAGGRPDDYGNNRTGQRLGQYVINKVGLREGSWPELFYAKHPDFAENLIHYDLT